MKDNQIRETLDRKQWAKDYWLRPEVQERDKQRRETPERRQYMKDYWQRVDVKTRRRERYAMKHKGGSSMRVVLEQQRDGSTRSVLYYDSRDELEQKRESLRLNIKNIKREIEEKQEQLEKCYTARKQLSKAKITKQKEN